MIDSFTYEEDLENDTYDSLTASMDVDDAGFETTSATLTHALFELASHPEIQERLVKELDEQLEGVDKSDLNRYYDAIINKAPYLEAVVKETLRKYPPVVRLERRVEPKEGVQLGQLHLDHGVLIEIPTISVHYDPEYYPEPTKFDPERFMPENKDRLVPYTYLPFGTGIGMRFAYQELKLCLASLLPKYQFSKSAKTPEILTFRK
ncbi:PREDICTED: cytochrome P450 3A21-like, partial [Rhagoletis zephyria]|uniref:cytochrome P450 3A21-like n=1 Tax=Rhagoletis zephyria TaxID=28612 RepID=UPI0008116663